MSVKCTSPTLVPLCYHTLEACLEGLRSLSVECTPPTLVSIYSSQSDLSAELYSMSVHRSIHKFYLMLIPISHTRGILGRALGHCLSNARRQLLCLSAPEPLNLIGLLNFIP